MISLYSKIPKLAFYVNISLYKHFTLDPKSFVYQFLATLDERGQGIPDDGDKRGGIKG